MNIPAVVDSAKKTLSGWLLVGLLLAVAAGNSGCVVAAVGAAAAAGAVGTASVQERTLGAAVDDTTLQVRLNARLLDDSASLFQDVDLTILEGRVYLTGIVPTDADRARASELIWKETGVKDVINELHVGSGGFTNYTKDSLIATQLRTKVLADGKIRDVNYSVTAVNQVVYVFGIGRTQEEVNRLLDHARTIDGVVKVVNHILVRDDPRRATQ